MLAQPWEIWLRRCRSAPEAVAPAAFAVIMALFAVLMPLEGQANERSAAISMISIGLNAIPPLSGQPMVRPISHAATRSAAVSDNADWPDSEFHAHWAGCLDGQCNGVSGALPATAAIAVPDMEARIRRLPDRLHLALTEPDAVFRPPRPLF